MSGEENLDHLRSRRKVNQALSGTLQGISERWNRIAIILTKLGDTVGGEKATRTSANARVARINSMTRQQQAEEKLIEEGVPESEWETKHRHSDGK